MADNSVQIRFAVSGDEEMARQFLTLGSRVRAAAVRALLASAQDLAAKASASAPVRTGQLRASIEPSPNGVMETQDRISIAVCPRGYRNDAARMGNYPVGLFNETGLAAKRIWIRGREMGQRVLAPRLGSRRRRVIKIHAPGFWRNRPAIAAHPFMGPAIASTKDSMMSRIDAAIADVLSRSAA